eukprot:scaffold39307_cov17-Tisochrysis_lutea.AAC.1
MSLSNCLGWQKDFLASAKLAMLCVLITAHHRAAVAKRCETALLWPCVQRQHTDAFVELNAAAGG